MSNYTEVRKNTIRLMEMVLEGEVDPQRLIQNLVNWMSEDEVKQFMDANGYNFEGEE